MFLFIDLYYFKLGNLSRDAFYFLTNSPYLGSCKPVNKQNSLKWLHQHKKGRARQCGVRANRSFLSYFRSISVATPFILKRGTQVGDLGQQCPDRILELLLLPGIQVCPTLDPGSHLSYAFLASTSEVIQNPLLSPVSKETDFLKPKVFSALSPLCRFSSEF